ncbi:hypothetical protein BD410DRAFT_801844 [Rickenella mellea]|uniref:Uncharacterized protein n=1 Tax=Rickenella mellea TaxID=50990 RepID=A0A4Y7QCA9_9AGAM|nr:hypothetical protein BD410DRAFT_801844 [Rickenella mellea]
MATMTQLPTAPHELQSLPSTSSLASLSSPSGGQFAIAQVHDSVCLVQSDSVHATSSSPLFMTPVELHIFRHEFGTMFRYSHRATLHPNDIHVLNPIDERHILREETGVVFVAREVTDQLLKWTKPRAVPRSPPHAIVRRRH